MTPLPPRTFRSALPPLVLILALTGGCESKQRSEARMAEKERLRAIQDTAERQKAETEKPSEAVLAQVRGAAEAYMKEQHVQEELDELVFTQLTPNLYLLGVKLKVPAAKSRSLTAERFRGEDGQEFYWVIEEASRYRMSELAARHGFDKELAQVASESKESDWGDPGGSGAWSEDTGSDARSTTPHRTSMHTASWLGPLLLWHYLYGRPSPMGFSYRNPQRGFNAFPPGYRYTAPQSPFSPAVKDRLGAIPARTGGHSAVFLGGSAWQPKAMGEHPNLNSARIYSASPQSGAATRVAPGSVSRGGFGSSGRSAASSGSHGSSSSSGS